MGPERDPRRIEGAASWLTRVPAALIVDFRRQQLQRGEDYRPFMDTVYNGGTSYGV